MVNSFILVFSLSMFDLGRNSTFFIFFAIFDFCDLDLPQADPFLKDSLKSFTLRYNLSSIENDRKTGYIRNLWPHMTSGDLATTFFLDPGQERHFDI